MRAAGYEPLEPYPGSGAPWRCNTCGHVGARRLSYIRNLIKVRAESGCAACSHAARGEQ